jgi:Tol biopolymer transport system component
MVIGSPSNFEEHRGQFSPDGRWVVYISDESGRPEIYVRPFPGPGGQWQVSTNGGVQPRWNPDGKELYYIAPDGQLMAASIAVQNGAIEAGAPMALFQTRVSGGGTNTYTKPQYDVAPDGRFLINTITDASTTAPITLLLNWKPRP